MDTNETPLNRITIFDTTLRDGEQSPGCSMNLAEKLRVAGALAAMRVDVIEAGFPVASEGDFEAVREIARRVEGPRIAALARCRREDIDRAWEAVRDATSCRIHVFLATSALHREHKLALSMDQIVEHVRAGVGRARSLCGDVEFSPEDASRTEPEFLARVVEAAIAEGATTINIPDTVGYATPEDYARVFEDLRRDVPATGRITLSAHCHDDLGLAVANTLAAIRAGARQVECTINGIGERAGNCPLEEVVMALRTRPDAFGCDTGIETTRLYPTSRMVGAITGSHVQRNKAIVGENAFAHEAGIHQHGVLQNRKTYEIIDPADVGFTRSTLVLGKHSGRHAVRDRIERLGHRVTEAELDRVTAAIKVLADRKKTIYDSDLEAVLFDQQPVDAGPWLLASLHVATGLAQGATATVRLTHVETDESRDEAAVGDGSVDAVFKAMARAAGVGLRLVEFQVRNVTVGEDAQGEAIIDVRHAGETFRGRGLSTDIVEASAIAVLDIINRVCRRAERIGHRPIGAVSIPMRD